MKIVVTIILLATLLGVFMANENISSNTHKNTNTSLDTNKQTERYHLRPSISQGLQTLVKEMNYLEAVAKEPKDEYIDYDPIRLVEHFTKKGWKVEVTSTEMNEEYGDKNFSIDFFKGDVEFGLYITLYRAGSDYAAKRFVLDVTAYSSSVPPYQVIPKEKNLGTLAVYRDVSQNSIHWIHRNAYTRLVPVQESSQPSALQMELALEVQKIFNEHTKKIKQ